MRITPDGPIRRPVGRVPTARDRRRARLSRSTDAERNAAERERQVFDAEALLPAAQSFSDRFGGGDPFDVALALAASGRWCS